MTQHAQGLSRLAFGAAAGFAGTLAIQALMTANQKRIPEAVESGAAKLLALG
jgi:hypothetical protein